VAAAVVVVLILVVAAAAVVVVEILVVAAAVVLSHICIYWNITIMFLLSLLKTVGVLYIHYYIFGDLKLFWCYH
jgi:hypothetical protein